MPDAQIDLSQVLDQVTNTNYGLKNASGQIEDTISNIIKTGAQRTNAVIKAGSDDAAVTAQEELGKLKAQQNARNAATMLGTNMDVSSATMEALSKQITDSYDKANSALDAVHEKQDSNFFSNPLQYIGDQLTLPGAVNEYNYQAQKHNLAEDQLESINKLTQSEVITQNAIAEVRTASSVLAKVDAIKQKALADAAQVTQQDLLYNIQGITAVQNMNDKQLDNVFRGINAIDAQVRIEFTRTQMELSRQNAQAMLEARQEKAKQLQLTAEDQQDTVDSINITRAGMGLAPVTATQALKLMKMGGPLGNSIKQQYLDGAAAKMSGALRIGNSPAQTAKLLLDTNAPLAPAQKQVKDLLTDTYSEASAGKYSATGLPPTPAELKDPNYVANATNMALLQKLKVMNANIKPGDNTNIYQAPDLGSIASNNIAVATSPFFQKVMKPTVSASSLVLTDPNVIFSMAHQAVKDKTVTFDEAVSGISNIFRAGVALNTVTKQYSKLNLPDQEHYFVKLKSISGTPHTYDLTKPEDVSQYLVNKQLTPKTADEMIAPWLPGAQLLPGMKIIPKAISTVLSRDKGAKQ